MSLGSINLSGIAGTARQHSLKQVSMLYVLPFDALPTLYLQTQTQCNRSRVQDMPVALKLFMCHKIHTSMHLPDSKQKHHDGGLVFPLDNY